ncbi:MAG: PKD domain-containing protein [Candidatus Thermoplasmatota archaeon]|nr:PKD domain-containing protein [Candidatus Thermoplasmatota archaeon]MCG2825914.1 PKD domain-containing protein [Thermoplasmatales archaeon]
MSKKMLVLGACVLIATFFIAMIPANVSADGTPFEYLSEEWRFSTENAFGLAVEDLDGDGIPELIVGGSRNVYVVNTTTHSQVWVSADLGGPIYGVDVSDIDNDGVKEIVVGTSNETISIYEGYLYVFDSITYLEEWSMNIGGRIYGVATDDIDDDGFTEIVVGYHDGTHQKCQISIFNGTSHEQEWQSGYLDMSSGVTNIILTDVDDDGTIEILVGGGTLQAGSYIYVFDGVTHVQEWKSIMLGYGLTVGDVDNDGQQEIITSKKGADGISIIDGNTKEIEWEGDINSVYTIIAGVIVGDIDGDRNPEIMVGWKAGMEGSSYVWIFDGMTHTIDWKSDALNIDYPGIYSTMKCLNIDGDEQIELVAGSFDGVVVWGNPPPTAYIDTINPSPARVGETVSFDCYGTDDESVVGYNWTSNLDGCLSTSKSFTTSDLSYGTHTIYLKVQDTEGLWSEIVSTTLTVGIAPNATIDSINPGVAVIGDTISFSGHGNDSDGSVSAYQWISNIGGLLSNSPSFNKADLSIGKHTITFRVKDNDGLWSDNATESLVVTAIPTAYIDSISPNPALLGNTVTFNGHGNDTDGTINAYNWTSSIDGLLSTSQSFNAGSLSIGHHTIYYKVKDNNDVWSNPDTMTLIVGTKPTANIDSITPKPVVEGNMVSFAGSGSDSDGSVLSYLWTSSVNGQLSTHSSFSTSTLSTGNHTIYFKVQDDDGFWSDEVTDTLKVLAKPTAYIDYVQPNLSAVGESVSFCGHGSDIDGNIVDYEWTSNIDGKLSNSSLFSISMLSSGNHTIFFRVKDNDGLWSAVVTTTVTVSKKPTAYIDTISPNPSKVGESVSFMGHGVDDDGSIIAYSWSSNISGTISTSNVFSISSLSAGNHLISFKVQDNSGLWSDETTAILEVRQSPVASLTVEPTAVYINELVAFDGSNSYQTGGTITHYFFDFGDDTNSSWTASPTTTHEYSDKGTYYAKLKVRDNYGIESSWSSVKITVQETPVLVLTAGLTNVGIIKSGGERVIPVYVTCYNMSAKNVHIVVVEGSGFIITMIPAEEDVNVGDTVTFNLRLTAPELAGNVTVGEKVIQIKAVSDETESNVETIYIILEKGAGTGQHGGFIPSFEATYLLAIIGICILLLRNRRKQRL